LYQAQVPRGLRGGKEEDGDSVGGPSRSIPLPLSGRGIFLCKKVVDVLVPFVHILV